MPGPRVLTLPGYTSAGPAHWLTLWEQLHPGVRRVEQDDWDRPDLDAWVARLEATLLQHASATAPVLLAAHSLGALLVAHWAERTNHEALVAGSLLVAPADVEQPDTPPALTGFGPVPRIRLPFPSVVVVGRSDPWVSEQRAAEFAAAWRSRLVDAGADGHLDSGSGLGVWPEGWRLLNDLATGGAAWNAG